MLSINKVFLGEIVNPILNALKKLYDLQIVRSITNLFGREMFLANELIKNKTKQKNVRISTRK